MITVDGRCSCQRCVARTENIYRMVGSCRNCGAKPILMIFRAGDPASSLDCPVCGCGRRVSADRLAGADEIPVAVPPPQEKP